MVVSGHTHDSWLVEHPFYEMDQNCIVHQKIQHHVKGLCILETPGHKLVTVEELDLVRVGDA